MTPLRTSAAVLAGALADPPALLAVLSHVRDPGNAGTVVRAADAAGAGQGRPGIGVVEGGGQRAQLLGLALEVGEEQGGVHGHSGVRSVGTSGSRSTRAASAT